MANTKKTTTPNTAEKKVTENAKKAEDTYTKKEVDAIVAKAVQEAVSQIKPTITQNVIQADEPVSLLFLGCIAKGTSIRLGKLGAITREGVVYEFPKKEFTQNFNSTIEDLIRERKLIIVDGLTDAEREQYDALYKEDEILTYPAYRNLLDYDVQKLTDIFEKLCPQHREIVSKMFYTAFAENGDNRVTLEKCRALNEICKSDNENNLFSNLIKFMGSNLTD